MKCYIIRLEENQQSCDMAKDCFDQATKFGQNPTYFKAVNGLLADQYYKEHGIKRARKFKKGRPGVIGCFFSHYLLWKMCAEQNESFLILEHDGYMLSHIPDFIEDTFEDILKLDNCDPYSKSYNQDVDAEIDLVRVIKYNNPGPKSIWIKEYGDMGDYCRGAYSYIIKPHAAQKLIDFVEKYGHLPADQQLNKSIVDLKVTIPTLARLHPFYSWGDNIRTASLTRNE